MEVLGDQEDEPEQAEERDGDGHGAGRELGNGEDPYVEQGLRCPQLDEDEGPEDDGGGGEAHQRRHRRPSPLRTLDDGEDQQGDPERRDEHPAGVEAMQMGSGDLRDEDLTKDQGDQDERDVDQKDRAVPVVLEQCTTGDGTERHRQTGGGPPDAESLLPLGGVREHRRQDRQGCREDEGCSHPHERTRSDELAG